MRHLRHVIHLVLGHRKESIMLLIYNKTGFANARVIIHSTMNK